MRPFEYHLAPTSERVIFTRGPLYNAVEVLGRGGLVGTARHEASISDPAHRDYLGRESLLRVIDETLTTQAGVDGMAFSLLERVGHSVTYERNPVASNSEALERVFEQLKHLNESLGGGPRVRSALP